MKANGLPPSIAALLLSACAVVAPPVEVGPLDAAQELPRLESDIAPGLDLDFGAKQMAGTERNIVGIRYEHGLLSRRLDSRTFFAQDDRLGQAANAYFSESDDEFLGRTRKILATLGVPAGEIGREVVLTEKVQTARFDPTLNAHVAGDIKVGRRYAEVARQVDGIPVFSSRASLTLKHDGRVGALEVHWPEVPKHIRADAARLQRAVRDQWKPPPVKGAQVESAEVGIVHSPAIGFAMDMAAVIRVIYRSDDPAIGKKPVYLYNAAGEVLPPPRTFEFVPHEEPLAPRPATKGQR